GYQYLANRKVYDAIPETSGSLIGKPIPLSFPRSDIKPPPTPEEIFNASIARLGPGALTANQRYRAETGRNIGYVDVSDQQLKDAWNPDKKTFELAPAPTQSFVRTLNAYNAGGVAGAEREAAKIALEDAATAK